MVGQLVASATAVYISARQGPMKHTKKTNSQTGKTYSRQSPLLAGDAIDIAFTVGHNDHPEYGGLELTLLDFVQSKPPRASAPAMQMV